MINCSECGAFISHDSSNLSHVCDDCKEEETIRAKIAKSNAIGMGLLEDVRLTDKEVRMLPNTTFNGWYNPSPDVVARAQLKKFREWLKSDVLEDCHEGYSNVTCFHKRALRELEDDCKA